MIAHLLSAVETIAPFLVVCALPWAKFVLLHRAKNRRESGQDSARLKWPGKDRSVDTSSENGSVFNASFFLPFSVVPAPFQFPKSSVEHSILHLSNLLPSSRLSH